MSLLNAFSICETLTPECHYIPLESPPYFKCVVLMAVFLIFEHYALEYHTIDSFSMFHTSSHQNCGCTNDMTNESFVPFHH